MINSGGAVCRHVLAYKTQIPLTFQLLVIVYLCFHTYSAFSFISSLNDVTKRVKSVSNCKKLTVSGLGYLKNVRFTITALLLLGVTVVCTWMAYILLLSGDIHLNSGPITTPNSSTSTANTSAFSFSNLNHHLSFVHYNVQSLVQKLDILETELFEFDILGFTESWLNPSHSSKDIRIASFNEPERKDRVGDSHGGVIIYIKDCIHYRRRNDLEPRGIECIWVQLTLNNKHVLFGLFYRPPNSDALYYSSIEDSIHLAVDTGISDIIITGDFNFNMFNNQTSRKIQALCDQFALYQSINEATHFTENSSSLIDLILVSNKDHLILSGVSDPFLHQEHRYHCPIYGVCNFRKPNFHSYKRKVWSYERGNYNLLREKVTSTDWDSCKNNGINIYAQNFKTP